MMSYLRMAPSARWAGVVTAWLMVCGGGGLSRAAPTAVAARPAATPTTPTTIDQVLLAPPMGWAIASKALRPSRLTSVDAARAPQARRVVILTRGAEQAVVLYLQYAGPAEARGALPSLRRSLAAKGEGAAPRLLCAGNLIAAIEANTLSVTLAVSRSLAAAGAIQDASEAGEPDEGAPQAVAPAEGDSAAVLPLGDGRVTERDAANPAAQAALAAALGKHQAASAAAGGLLQEKRYPEALAAYRRMERAVTADRQASDLARWDALSGVGLAAAGAHQMAAARDAFQRALVPAGRLDPRKLAETAFNLACAEAELRHTDAALKALQRCLAAAKKAGPERLAHFQQVMTTDPSLKALQRDPRLQRLLAP